jgi:hypothetical protein
MGEQQVPPYTGPPGPVGPRPQGGPGVGPGFSADGLWWWNGAAWFPTQPPTPQDVRIAPPSIGEQIGRAVLIVDLIVGLLIIFFGLLAAVLGR